MPPREAIDAILARHETVRQLVEGGWLFLVRMGSGQGDFEQRHVNGWTKQGGDRMKTLNHLDALEAEAIHIMREVAANFENPVMFYSDWQVIRR